MRSASRRPDAPERSATAEPQAAAPRRRVYTFARALRHSSATHVFVFLLLFVTGVGPRAVPREPPREVRIVVEARLDPPSPEVRPEPERALEREVPAEPELVPVEPEPSEPPEPEPEPEFAELDPLEPLRRAPQEPLARLEPPPEPIPEPPPEPAPEVAQAEPEPEPPLPPPSAPVPVVTEHQPPVLLSSRAPDYPYASYRMGHQGAVLLRIHVAPDGAVVDVEVVESSGYELLDRAALAAVRHWRFRPGTEDGDRVLASLLHRVIFRIES